ncbi:unnamed protein product [Ectocarpus sp. 4 AP-2014]
MSSFSTSTNALKATGLVAVTKGYEILADIKADDGIFRTEAIEHLVPEKSGIVSCVHDADAKLVARTLKKRARKRGLKANDWSQRRTSRDRNVTVPAPPRGHDPPGYAL